MENMQDLLRSAHMTKTQQIIAEYILDNDLNRPYTWCQRIFCHTFQPHDWFFRIYRLSESTAKGLPG